jgi:hypothetical protein
MIQEPTENARGKMIEAGVKCGGRDLNGSKKKKTGATKGRVNTREILRFRDDGV